MLVIYSTDLFYIHHGPSKVTLLFYNNFDKYEQISVIANWNAQQVITSTEMRSCRDLGMAVIHLPAAAADGQRCSFCCCCIPNVVIMN